MNRREALQAARELGKQIGSDAMTASLLSEARIHDRGQDAIEELWAIALQYGNTWVGILCPAEREDASGEPAYGDQGSLSVEEAREAWEKGLRSVPIDDDD